MGGYILENGQVIRTAEKYIEYLEGENEALIFTLKEAQRGIEDEDWGFVKAVVLGATEKRLPSV